MVEIRGIAALTMEGRYLNLCVSGHEMPDRRKSKQQEHTLSSTLPILVIREPEKRIKRYFSHVH